MPVFSGECEICHRIKWLLAWVFGPDGNMLHACGRCARNIIDERFAFSPEEPNWRSFVVDEYDVINDDTCDPQWLQENYPVEYEEMYGDDDQSFWPDTDLRVSDL